jgi:hypothetical protein
MRGPIGIALVTIIAACGTDRPAEQPPETAAPPPAPAAELVPDTTDAALWAWLQAQNYHGWRTFPGTGERHPGTEPHGALLTTYVNDLAHDAIANHAVTLPPGAVLVTESFAPDATLTAIAVMHKVQGYDGDHADWYWAKYDAGGTAEASGRVASCAECHGQRADRDHIMASPPGG